MFVTIQLWRVLKFGDPTVALVALPHLEF